MAAYVIRRLITVVPILVAVTFLVFLIIYITPGDPAEIVAGPDATQEVVNNIRKQMGLDRPFPVQFGVYLWNVVHGNLGRSYVTQKTVSSEIAIAFPNTFRLVVVAEIFSILVAIPMGVLAAVKLNTLWDRALTAISVLGISVPIFVTALLAIWIFGARLDWLPISGRGGSLLTLSGWKHIALPAVTLGYYQVGTLERIVRSSVLDTLSTDYVRTARSKGLRESRVVYRHALRNALLPTVTIVGLQFGFLLGGAVVTETIFAWPGMGQLTVGALNNRDFPLAQGPILVFAALFVIINLVTDLSYGVLDPRIRYR